MINTTQKHWYIDIASHIYVDTRITHCCYITDTNSDLEFRLDDKMWEPLCSQ